MRLEEGPASTLMDYFLLPPLLRWEDIPDPNETSNLLDAVFPSDPTVVLCPEKLTRGEEVDKESLDLDSESVTNFQTENGDIFVPDSNLKAKPKFSNLVINQTKVQVKLARRWRKNVILSQFASILDTDTSSLSCVWEENPSKNDFNNHMKSNHEVTYPVNEATAQTAKAPSSSLVPLQVPPTTITSVGGNAASKISAAGSLPVDFFLVSFQLTQTSDLNFTLTATLKRPGPRLIWKIAWYVSSCLVI